LKRVIFTIAIIAATALLASDMPPMPPGMMDSGKKSVSGEQKKDTKQKTKKKGNGFKMPKECSTLPPMIIFLPPPMEVEMRACKNALHLPKKEDALKKLKASYKKDVVIKSIEPADGFVEVYQIDIEVDKKQKSLFCNGKLEYCIEGANKKM
jgi:hypothetical protein